MYAVFILTSLADFFFQFLNPACDGGFFYLIFLQTVGAGFVGCFYPLQAAKFLF